MAFHGVAIAGGTVTTINSLASESDLTEQLAATRARFLLTVAPFCDRALPAARTAGVEEVFVLGEAAEGTSPFSAILGDPAKAPDACDLDPADSGGRDADVVGHDRVPEGGPADAPQPGGERDPDQRGDRPARDATR